jgi:hypothetical protein
MAHFELVGTEQAPTAALIEDGADNEGNGIGSSHLLEGPQVDFNAAKAERIKEFVMIRSSIYLESIKSENIQVSLSTVL